MTIQYLKKLEANPVVWDSEEGEDTELVGCTVREIEELENKISKKLPQAYREYLFLAGKENPFFGNAVDYSYDRGELERIQADCKEFLQEHNIELKTGFWVIESYLNDQFHFFYLDEGDNPQVYHFCDFCTEKHGYKDHVSITSKPFSVYIEESISSKSFMTIFKVLVRITKLFYKIKYRNRRAE